jgi:hypothetical protein
MHVCLDDAAAADKPARPREKPVAKAEPVVEEEPAPAAGKSSILSYKETDEGSFLGIAEFGDDEEEAEPVEETPQEQQAKSSAVDALKQVVEKEPPKVKGGDSALDAFFQSLD